jgi:23S rRNA pseudouridine2457 synthase
MRMLTKAHFEKHSYYVFYKPYNVLNQFSKERAEHVTLADYLKVDKDIYPVGRLDKDSEGLLILTNDKALNGLLLKPSMGHKRTYMVQLDQDITDKAIAQVAKGVQIKLDSGIYHTDPCEVKKLHKAPVLPERHPPVRFRKEIPTSWALIKLSEGKNRQVRKMFASVGYPVLRLVRVQIEDLKIGKMQPGESMSLKGQELYKLLHIDPASYVKPKPRTTTKAGLSAPSRSKPVAKTKGKSSTSPKTGSPAAKTSTKPSTAKSSSQKPTSSPTPSTKPSTPRSRPSTPTKKASSYKQYRGKR